MMLLYLIKRIFQIHRVINCGVSRVLCGWRNLKSLSSKLIKFIIRLEITCRGRLLFQRRRYFKSCLILFLQIFDELILFTNCCICLLKLLLDSFKFFINLHHLICKLFVLNDFLFNDLVLYLNRLIQIIYLKLKLLT